MAPTGEMGLAGRVAVVTGATAGIGFAVANALFHRGAKVYLAARNEEKARASIRRLEDSRREGSGEAIYHHLDLDDPKGTKESANEFLKREERLDILGGPFSSLLHAIAVGAYRISSVNNAALTDVDYELNEALGIQRIMVVNFFSTRIFTESLLPVLRRTDNIADSDVRIVNLSSNAHRIPTGDPPFKAPEDFNKEYGSGMYASMQRYGLTKAALNLWTVDLQTRLSEAGSNIIVLAVHPGVVLTEGFDVASTRWPIILQWIYKPISRLFFLTAEQGIMSTMFAATDPILREKPTEYKGAYIIHPGKLAKATPQSVDPERAKNLRAFTDQKLKEWDISLE